MHMKVNETCGVYPILYVVYVAWQVISNNNNNNNNSNNNNVGYYKI